MQSEVSCIKKCFYNYVYIIVYFNKAEIESEVLFTFKGVQLGCSSMNVLCPYCLQMLHVTTFYLLSVGSYAEEPVKIEVLLITTLVFGFSKLGLRLFSVASLNIFLL